MKDLFSINFVPFASDKQPSLRLAEIFTIHKDCHREHSSQSPKIVILLPIYGLRNSLGESNLFTVSK